MNGFVRKFGLESADGIRLALNGEQDIWLTDPAGLGISSAPKLADYGGGFFGSTDNRYEPQQTITFTLNFTGAFPYAEYQAFLDTICSAEQWYLCYQPDEASIEYRRKISFRSITKTELTKTRWLECTVSAVCLAPWQRVWALTMAGRSGTSATGKTIGIWEAKVYPDGHLPLYCTVEFKAASAQSIGMMNLPYKNGNSLAVESGAEAPKNDAWLLWFSPSLPLTAGESLLVSMVPNDFYILKKDAAGEITSEMGDIALPFLGLAKGLPSNARPLDGSNALEFSITTETYNAADQVKVNVYAFFKGV